MVRHGLEIAALPRRLPLLYEKAILRRLACKRAHDGLGSLLPFFGKKTVGYFWIHFPKSMQSELVSFRRRILLRRESSYLAMRQVAGLRKTIKGESREKPKSRRSCNSCTPALPYSWPVLSAPVLFDAVLNQNTQRTEGDGPNLVF